jgi:hypothetical protein
MNAIKFAIATTLCSTSLGIDTRSQQKQKSLASLTNSTTTTSTVANVTSGAIESTMDILLRFQDQISNERNADLIDEHQRETECNNSRADSLQTIAQAQQAVGELVDANDYTTVTKSINAAIDNIRSHYVNATQWVKHSSVVSAHTSQELEYANNEWQDSNLRHESVVNTLKDLVDRVNAHKKTTKMKVQDQKNQKQYEAEADEAEADEAEADEADEAEAKTRAHYITLGYTGHPNPKNEAAYHAWYVNRQRAEDTANNKNHLSQEEQDFFQKQRKEHEAQRLIKVHAQYTKEFGYTRKVVLANEAAYHQDYVTRTRAIRTAEQNIFTLLQTASTLLKATHPHQNQQVHELVTSLLETSSGFVVGGWHDEVTRLSASISQSVGESKQVRSKPLESKVNALKEQLRIDVSDMKLAMDAKSKTSEALLSAKHSRSIIETRAKESGVKRVQFNNATASARMKLQQVDAACGKDLNEFKKINGANSESLETIDEFLLMLEEEKREQTSKLEEAVAMMS